MPNKNLKLTLNDKDVHCTYKEDGCKWIGKLRDLEKHLNIGSENSQELEGCKFAIFDCIYCDDPIRRASLYEHRSRKCPKRPYICDYCNDYRSNYTDVTENHVQECPHAPVKCTNYGCKASVKRRDLGKHIEEDCTKTIVNCEFSFAGCPSSFPKDRLDNHNSRFSSHHTSLMAKHFLTSSREMNEKVVKLEKENEDLKKSVAELVKENTALSTEVSRMRNDHNNIVEDLKRDLNTLKSQNSEENKTLKQDLEQVRASSDNITENLKKDVNALRLESTQKSKEIKVLKLDLERIRAGNTTQLVAVQQQMSRDRESQQSAIKDQIRKQVAMQVGQVKRESKQDIAVYQRIDGVLAETQQLSLMMNQLSTSVAEHTRDLERVDKVASDLDRTRSRVAVNEDQIEKVRTYASTTLTSRAKIYPFDVVMENFPNFQVTNAEWSSPPFYINDYKLCLTIYANGDPTKKDKSNGSVSLYLHLMQGENDLTLQWPFLCTIYLTLVHPRSPEFNKTEELPFKKDTPAIYSGRVTDRRRAKGWGYASFITQREAEKFLWKDGNELHIRISKR